MHYYFIVVSDQEKVPAATFTSLSNYEDETETEKNLLVNCLFQKKPLTSRKWALGLPCIWRHLFVINQGKIKREVVI